MHTSLWKQGICVIWVLGYEHADTFSFPTGGMNLCLPLSHPLWLIMTLCFLFSAFDYFAYLPTPCPGAISHGGHWIRHMESVWRSLSQSRCLSDDCVAPCDFIVKLRSRPDRNTNFIWCAQDEDVLLKTDPNAVVLIWNGTSCHICTLLIWHPGRWVLYSGCEHYLMMLKCDNLYKMPVHNVIASHWKAKWECYIRRLIFHSPFVVVQNYVQLRQNCWSRCGSSVGLIVSGFLTETKKIAIVRPNKKVYTDLMARSLMSKPERSKPHGCGFQRSLDFSPLASPANWVPAWANHHSEMFMMHLGCFISRIKVFDKCLKRQPRVITQAISQTLTLQK